MDIELVKAYIREDDDSDETMRVIELCMNVAEEFITASVGSFDINKFRVKMLYLSIVQHFYDNRSLLDLDASGKQKEISRMYQSIIMQLQMENLAEGSV